MAAYNIICQAGTSNVSVNLNSTKIKVISNVAVYYAVGQNPVAYNSGNCFMIPANTIRDINCGPGTQTVGYVWGGAGNVVATGVGPQVAFLTSGGTAQVDITEIGFVDFTRVTN